MKVNKLFIVLILTLTLVNSYTLQAKNEDNIFYRHNNKNMKIALTFDDGPHKQYTSEILDILKEYEIKATFFIIGVNAAEYPELLLRIQNEGHEIGNHTYHHSVYNDNSIFNQKQEILLNEKLIYELTEYRPKLYRPPGGFVCNALIEMVYDLGYSLILWNVDTNDWKAPPSRDIAESVLTTIKSGDIILCHDYVENNNTPKAMRIFIPELIKRGYKFVTVSELIMSN